MAAHCKKKVCDFPIPSRDVTYSYTILSPGENNLIIPGQGEFGKCYPDWGRENRQTFFTVLADSFSLYETLLLYTCNGACEVSTASDQ
jgi:hypothetical protein